MLTYIKFAQQYNNNYAKKIGIHLLHDHKDIVNGIDIGKNNIYNKIYHPQ